jgi:hypothetical protein
MISGSSRLDQYVDALYREPAPSRLYHYTSLNGLLGILKNKHIWATEVRYLNDSAEIKTAFRLMERSLVARLRTEVDPSSREILEQLKEWIDTRASAGPMVFVASFTQNGNLLSQWRGYAPTTQGASFGLASSHLSAVSVASGFALGRCRYDEDDQLDALDGLIESVISLAARTGPSELDDERPSFNPTFDLCEESILRVAALIKDSRFKEEAEWRIVSKIVSDDLTTEVSYRVGSSMLIPYMTMELANAEGIVPIDDVIVGPTPHPQAATASIQRLLAQHLQRKHSKWKTRYCDIPYRAW